MTPKMPARDVVRDEFAKKLEHHMADRGWNQSDLARAASKFLPEGEDFRRHNIHVYLNKTALPRPKHLQALAKALGVSQEDLLPDVRHAQDTLPFSMRAASDDPSQAYLNVDMKVPMHTALAVLSLLNSASTKAQ